MPIKGEYCDAWYEACKDDYYCYDAANNSTSWFSHPVLRHKGECTQASGNCKTFADVFGAAACLPACPLQTPQSPSVTASRWASFESHC